MDIFKEIAACACVPGQVMQVSFFLLLLLLDILRQREKETENSSSRSLYRLVGRLLKAEEGEEIWRVREGAFRSSGRMDRWIGELGLGLSTAWLFLARSFLATGDRFVR